ncbi:site-specific DNA-methyltransferase [Fictibacillus barbaricus]|uniref:Adenine-specific DNA-methyltransferase n=1 Tax=Fictibacillus barbaricus TaxID=182136 RepID=A0ABU1U5R9_9BACL|nr:DNA methyltransferase [Fictibacillus barbaricus]MDR7074743.1 adenine-specific DNA-methyltransferase [Fictibacillus barbaricus]
MSTQLNNFIKTLEEMFQFDQADLDFGIYRIMNQKREEVTHFLHEDLVPQVKESLGKYKNADIETIKQEILKLENQLSEMGVAKESSEKYQTLTKQLNQGVDITALENEVYSDLSNFFKRYYHEGDFISLRRYKRDVYSIPYEGEETKLHWANADQYYVKSSEFFHDYTFTLPSGKKVHFKIVKAGTELNNNKAQEGKERRFILMNDAPLIEETGELTIKFEYKPDEKKRTREKINEETIESIISHEGFKNWIEELKTVSPTEKNKNRTLIEKHLNDYTAKNSFDYFIHKDLGSFLRRELDFYIKNEVMHLDDLDTENEKRFEQYLSKVKVIKSIGEKIINFLEQIENFQKKLWLKKKFVIETNYCITLDRIPEILFKEIINNQEQIKEWNKLFKINKNEPLTAEFLKSNKNLVLDTKFFESEFVFKILSSIEDIDEKLDGVIINSDNFHALNLIENKYSNSLSSVYIDPPYNTGGDGFIYKDNYKHSSWLSFMENRINAAYQLINNDKGIFCSSIDKNEMFVFKQLLDSLLGEEAFVNAIVNVNNPKGRSDQRHLPTAHDNILFYSFSEAKSYGWNPPENVIRRYNKVDSEGKRYREIDLRKTGDNDLREDRPNMFYYFYYNEENNEFFVSKEKINNNEGYIEIIPLRADGREGRWRWGIETTEKNIENLIPKFMPSRKVWSVFEKDYLSDEERVMPTSVWAEKEVNSERATEQIIDLGFEKSDFPRPKPVGLLELLLRHILSNDGVILDFFAGSGTTAHALINLNREDEGNRKYILVEMGNHFEYVLKPRIQKAIYSKDWENGNPLSREGSSHMFKYICLESYEDSLNNIELKRTAQQEFALQNHMTSETKEEYYISYMLDIESEGSTSLINFEDFKNPFDYKMKISNGSETKLKRVDLVETFNYLIGIQINKIDYIRGFQIISGELRSGDNVLIIWRNLTESTNDDLEAFFLKQRYNSIDSEFDRIYVNGDNHLENLKIDENKWKVVLIEEEFKRLMFDVKDL